MIIQVTYVCCLGDVAWWLLIVCFSMFVPFMYVIRGKSRWGWARGGVGWSRPGTRAICWRQAIHPCIPILPMFYYLHCFTNFYYYVSYILVVSFGLDEKSYHHAKTLQVPKYYLCIHLELLHQAMPWNQAIEPTWIKFGHTPFELKVGYLGDTFVPSMVDEKVAKIGRASCRERVSSPV